MWPLTVREVIEACDARCGPSCHVVCGASCRALAAAAGGALGLMCGATGSLVELAAGDLFVALPFVNGDAHARVEQALSFGAALALVSEAWPGLGELPPELRARCGVVPDVVAAFRRLAAVLRARLPCPVAVVAGSNGKTTTKEMLAALLASPGRRVVKTPGTDNGHLGLPQTLCARALHAASPADAVVLEIGIDAPLAMAGHARMIAPDLALITALGPEHLGGLGDVATAVREELALLTCSPGARRVLPLDDPEIAARPSLLRAGDVAVLEGTALSEVPVGLAKEVSVVLFQARLSGGESRLELVFHRAEYGSAASQGVGGGEGRGPLHRFEMRCPLPGRHNARNLALAAAAALRLGRTPEEIRAGWQTFEAPPSRSSVAPLARGALLYDDCFNASPLSMQAVLDALCDPAWAARPKLVVLGDMLDLGGESTTWHLALAERLSGMAGVRAYLFGVAMGAVAERLRMSGGEGAVPGHLESGDPVELVRGLDLPERAVVLVKGSRGMRMERVARYLARRWAVEAAPRAPAGRSAPDRALSSGVRVPPSGAVSPEGGPGSIAVVGVGRGPVARAVAEAVGASHPVLSPGHDDLLSTAAENRLVVLVFTGLDAGDLPPGVDAETHLAHVAQLLVRDRPPRTLVMPAGDAVCDLLAEVAPRETQVLRYGGAAAPEEVVARLVVAALGGAGGGGGVSSRDGS